jgi:hypothetical protein
MTTKNIQKSPYKFICEKCNYKCNKKSEFSKHLNTAKHNKTTNDNTENLQCYICSNCNKNYSDRVSLWRHRQKCRNIDDHENDSINGDLITKLLLQNQELLVSNQQFKELMVEQSKQLQEQQTENKKLQSQLIEAVKDTGNIYNSNNNTINSNNQKFNLNFFLNTTCKDAMNMSDFIENMEIDFKDIENIGRNGYVSGMTEMILSRIKELDVTKRPLHCTDLKRETMYIKDNDEWCKDTPENTKLRKTIGYVAKRNYATIPLWREKYPECQNWNDPKYDFCVDMMRNILGDIGEKQTRLDNKVIKNLSKHIVVDKNQ